VRRLFGRFATDRQTPTESDQSDIEARAELLAPVAESFGRAIRHFGPINRGVGWKSPDGHQLRFDVLAGVFGPEAENGGLIVNDLGCGYGAFFDFLKDRPALRGGRYYGYDISEDMLITARDRIDDPRASFEFASRAAHSADYSFVCGSYNIKMYASDEEWRTFIETSLLELWSKTKVALAYNMMSTYGEPLENTIYYADPAVFFDFCMHNLSPNVTLLHDYSLPEWTMFVYR
jgi:SAM-dependent methyltransferase